VEEGDEVSPFYDPMIAKLVTKAEDRELAIDNLASLCRSVEVWPVRTNAGFLARLLDAEGFRAGEADTGFIARNLEELALRPEPELLEEGVRIIVPRFVRDVPHGLRGFRLNGPRMTSARFLVDGRETELAIDVETPFDYIGLVRWTSEAAGIVLFEGGEAYLLETAFGRGGGPEGGTADGAMLSPMPGRIISVEVRQGDSVTKGQKLLTLEAMKMEHSLVAPFDGIVAELEAKEGAQVSEGTLLVRVEKG
jgi:3-methylcrotonyl-CoA carboxylase alpha subunit